MPASALAWPMSSPHNASCSTPKSPRSSSVRSRCRPTNITKPCSADTHCASACGQCFERYDLLLSPTLPVAGVDVGINVPAGLPGRNLVSWVSYTYPFNLTGQPAASIPAGFTRAGLPVGLQLVARPYREEDLFAAAAAFEAARPWAQHRPSLGGLAS